MARLAESAERGEMGREQPPRGLLCTRCGTGLEPLGESTADEVRLVCRGCGETYRARRRGAGPEASTSGAPEAAPVGSLALFWRGLALRTVERVYRAGVVVGSVSILLTGGIVPVARRWLHDEIRDWPGVLRTLGGVHVVTEIRDPDADLGPMLARVDAPLLFAAVEDVSRRLAVRPPAEIRLTYLPCCGVVAWERSRALILGLPLLRVLTLAELRAILAHELAHLARGDATRAARSVRFVEGLRRALDEAGGRARGPLGAWARLCWRWSNRLIGPIARGQEARADRSAAAIAGGTAAASALVKVAMVQPLFREVLDHYDPSAPDAPNLYAFFRTFWYRLPAEIHTAMRLQVLTSREGAADPAHPPLPHRLALIQTYPDPAGTNGEGSPATTYLGDLEAIEQMLHNRLFALPAIEPTVFHKARG